MKIGIVGAGGVGGYFGALLAKAGHDIRVLARGAHLAAIQNAGLKLEGPRGDVQAPVRASDDARVLEGVAFVLFSVKSYDTAAAAQTVRPALGEAATLVTLQNGIDSAERLCGIFPRAAILPGIAFMSGVITRPGVIRYTSAMSSIVIGEEDGQLSERCRRLQEACEGAGFGCEISPDIRAAQWKKFVAFATNAALTGAVRQPVGVVYGDPDLRAVALRSMDEVIAVAKRHGVNLPPDAKDSALALLDSFPPDLYASLYHDLARGRPIENDAISGAIVRLAKRYGIDVPIHQFAYAALKPYEMGQS